MLFNFYFFISLKKTTFCYPSSSSLSVSSPPSWFVRNRAARVPPRRCRHASPFPAAFRLLRLLQRPHLRTLPCTFRLCVCPHLRIFAPWSASLHFVSSSNRSLLLLLRQICRLPVAPPQICSCSSKIRRRALRTSRSS